MIPFTHKLSVFFRSPLMKFTFFKIFCRNLSFFPLIFWQILRFFSGYFAKFCVILQFINKIHFFFSIFWQNVRYSIPRFFDEISVFPLFFEKNSHFSCDPYMKFVGFFAISAFFKYFLRFFDSNSRFFAIFWWNLSFYDDLLTKFAFLCYFCEICSFVTIIWRNFRFLRYFGWNFVFLRSFD